MKMYSRDDLMNSKNLGDEDDDEDDEEEETSFPSKLVMSNFLSSIMPS